MSSPKHALVVDDSKSARAVMRRMLEKHAITVDTVNAAEEALDYLTHNRPDIIFMDHLMPGMDGFDAVKAIKRNPATATIPILMYTTKSGDLYLSQARALGAVGVLPKTVAPAELFEALRRLGLVTEHRTEPASPDEETASKHAQAVEPRGLNVAPEREIELPIDVRTAATPDEFNDRMRKLLDEQRVALRKDILVSMDSVSKYARAKIEQEMESRLDPLKDRLAAMPQPSTAPAVLLGVLLFASLAWNYSLYRDFQILEKHRSNASASLAQTLPAPSPTPTGDTQTHVTPMSWALLDWSLNQNLQYPYDEVALDKARLDTTETLLTKLADNDFRGKVVLETHAGEFCLLGNANLGYRLPPPELPIDRCDFIGNPAQATDSPAAHQSLQFANFVASSPLLKPGGPITLVVVAFPRAVPLVPYPARDAATTAQEWNTAAAQNNRMIVRLEPSASALEARLDHYAR